MNLTHNLSKGSWGYGFYCGVCREAFSAPKISLWIPTLGGAYGAMIAHYEREHGFERFDFGSPADYITTINSHPSKPPPTGWLRRVWAWVTDGPS